MVLVDKCWVYVNFKEKIAMDNFRADMCYVDTL